MIVTTALALNSGLASPWWLSVPLWLCLGYSAWIDGRTGRVPNKILFPGAIYCLVVLGFLAFQKLSILASLDFIGFRFLSALAVGAVFWLFNEVWWRWKRQDAIGMGDAKWSALAVLGFGVLPVLWAWSIAAWLGLGWIGLKKLKRRKTEVIYFAPFLFIGLVLIKLWLT